MSELQILVAEWVFLQEGQFDSPKLLAADAVTVTEAATVELLPVLLEGQETVTVTEAVGVVLVLGFLSIEVFDLVLAQDYSNLPQPVALAVWDRVLVQEGQDDHLHPVILETVTVTDSASLRSAFLFVSVQELMTVVDSSGVATDPLGAVGVVAFDTVIAQEEVVPRVTVYINAVDAVQVVDGAWAPDVFEAVTVAEDAIVAITPHRISVVELLTVTEVVALAGVAHNVVVGEDVLVADAGSLLLAQLELVAGEDVTLLEAVTVALSSIALNVSVTEDVTVTEDLTAYTNPIQIDEFTQIILTEDVPLYLSILTLEIFEAVTLAEHATVQLSLVLLDVFDTVTLTERIAMRIATGTGAQVTTLLPLVGVGR